MGRKNQLLGWFLDFPTCSTWEPSQLRYILGYSLFKRFILHCTSISMLDNCTPEPVLTLFSAEEKSHFSSLELLTVIWSVMYVLAPFWPWIRSGLSFKPLVLVFCSSYLTSLVRFMPNIHWQNRYERIFGKAISGSPYKPIEKTNLLLFISKPEAPIRKKA